MSDSEGIENARAEREARDASVQRTSRGPVARAIQVALGRYLASEQYHDRREPQPGPSGENPGANDVQP